MSRLVRSSLMLGVAVISLAACSSNKGPGEIGTKNDIVVRNNGLPQAQQDVAAAPAPQTGDFTSTVEQGEAMPAPDVAAAEPLPDTSPAMEQAVQAQAEATAPLPSTATDPAMQSAVPADPATNPIDAVAPEQPVTETVAPPPADMAAAPDAPAYEAPAMYEEQAAQAAPVADTAATTAGTVYPAEDYAAAPAPQAVEAPAYEAAQQAYEPVTTTATAPVIPPAAPMPEGVKYPLDPNAPYSPKAVAAAIADSHAAAAPAASAGYDAAGSAAPMPSTPNINDPAVVRAAQAALKEKGVYRGEQTGEVDAAFLNALIVYQAQNGLPQGGLNEATLQNLGVFQ